ncbi:MAG: class I tRNA ligase family protein [Saprospiraceae bacterium]
MKTGLWYERNLQQIFENKVYFKTEDYQNNVGRSERTNAVIEPRLSLQWYVDMKSLADPALSSVMNDEIEFFPKTQKYLSSLDGEYQRLVHLQTVVVGPQDTSLLL